MIINKNKTGYKLQNFRTSDWYESFQDCENPKEKSTIMFSRGYKNNEVKALGGK